MYSLFTLLWFIASASIVAVSLVMGSSITSTYFSVLLCVSAVASPLAAETSLGRQRLLVKCVRLLVAMAVVR